MQVASTDIHENAILTPNQNLQYIFEQAEQAIRNLNLNEGDFFSFSDENHRVNVSPYRLTMEIRYPHGLAKLKE